MYLNIVRDSKVIQALFRNFCSKFGINMLFLFYRLCTCRFYQVYK